MSELTERGWGKFIMNWVGRQGATVTRKDVLRSYERSLCQERLQQRARKRSRRISGNENSVVTCQAEYLEQDM
jgi:hypothetical protein